MTLSRLSDALVAEGQIEEVTKCHSEENGGSFRKIQDRNLLVEDEDLDECAVYFRETESRFVTMKERISLFKKYTLLQNKRMRRCGVAPPTNNFRKT